MILIQRYIFRELLYNFVFTFVVITLIIFLATAVDVIFKFPWLEFSILIRNIPIFLTASLTIVVPTSILVATVMTYGRISADNEIVTMRASGIHIFRILIPGILLGLLASFLLIIINDRIVPKAEYRLRSVLNETDLAQMLDARLQSGIKHLELKDWLITWDSYKKLSIIPEPGKKGKPREGWRLNSLRLKRYDSHGVLKNDVIAESGTAVIDPGTGKLFLMCKGLQIIGGQGFQGGLLTSPLDLSSNWQPPVVRLHSRTLSALSAMLKREDKAYSDYEVKTEIHKRIADSLSPLVFIFLSLPVALLFRQQNRMLAFLIAILVALFIYYPVSLLGETIARQGKINPVLCLWPGNIFLVLLGIALIVKVMRR